MTDPILRSGVFFKSLSFHALVNFVENNIPINREYACSVAVYQKYLKRLGELIAFEPWRENFHFS